MRAADVQTVLVPQAHRLVCQKPELLDTCIIVTHRHAAECFRESQCALCASIDITRQASGLIHSCTGTGFLLAHFSLDFERVY